MSVVERMAEALEHKSEKFHQLIKFLTAVSIIAEIQPRAFVLSGQLSIEPKFLF